MWDLSRSGIEPGSPALAGIFFTNEPQGKPLFYSFYDWVAVHCIYVPCLLHPFIYWWTFRYFHVLWTVLLWTSGCMHLFDLQFCVRRSKIAGSHGNPVFGFLRNLHTVSTVALPTYIPTNSVGGLLFPPHPLQHLLFVGFSFLFIWLCCTTCGILVPWPGIELRTLAVRV